ncbi:MAG: 1-acyl-sn-glycerol-3-phosphate acyltransferase [Puniceicoccales bacterium]|nr:1-acyl-sn-glycerol-3-phosphate acyltransferase [Puniceicoccales bacterium]
MAWNPYYLVVQSFFKLCFREIFDGNVHGKENIPKTGAFLTAANHASFLDPPFISAIINRSDMFYFARKTLMTSGLLGFIVKRINTIPVDRDAGSDITAIKKVFNLLKNGHGVVIFPEGARSPDGEIHEAKPGIGLIACKSSVPVVPMRLFGTYEIWGRQRKWPSINVKAHIVVGHPLHSAIYDPGPEHKNRYQCATNRIMESIKALQEPKQFP